jgi:hypothetical protein
MVSHSSGQSLYLLTAFLASPENPTHPSFLDVPLYSSILPSDLDESFLDEVFAPTSYFDLSAPTTPANTTSRPDTTVPSAQLSWSNANSVDPGMIVDSTDGFDVLNPWQAQMDGTAIDEVLHRYALSVSNRTPSLCSSDGGYSSTLESGAVTPEPASSRPSAPAASNRLEKQPGVTNGLKRTRGALKTANPDSRECVARRAAKPAPYSSKVERKRSCNLSEDKATSQIQAKKAHSAVERRYRENLNSKIMDLHHTLLATEFGSWSSGVENIKEEWGKTRKSDVLVNAMTYVHQSEIEMRHMSEEIRQLRGQSR